MSASVLSSIYDFDLLYRQEKTQSSNAIHLNSMMERRSVVGLPLATSNANSNRSNYFRSNSLGHMDSSFAKESAAVACTNKENRYRDRAYSESGQQQLQDMLLQPRGGSQINSTRYKTELCRPFEENGSCKYGEKCQFAHGYHELRNLSRHPKYKTEPCRTFHTIGFCPYGPRCHFIHNVDERRPVAPMRLKRELGDREMERDEHELQFLLSRDNRPKLHHSLSFSGFSSPRGVESAPSRTPPPPPPPLTSTACLSAFSCPEQDLKAFLAPLIPHALGSFNGVSYGGSSSSVQAGPGCPLPPSPPPPFRLSNTTTTLRPLSQSPVFDSPPSPLESLSDPESLWSGSCCSSGTISGSESPSLDANRRLPIFSRLSISDD
ncbi:mRNA decay activator protein ZFP36L2 isoform X1 [Astyanax mexicanus]|uniref:mRNA decay activator protein ZFP36L2 isoform X1 n=1 Tax=Astyanax mexicanus TaxID=7994 RepID=UPI0020CAFA96|nr:mRNA decay activator protein ZFP36L2 isoform X1 [Astyanax mexicanus]